MIPPYSEQIIKCRTNERGVMFIEHQLLQPGLIAASSLVSCEETEFACLVVNLTDQTINMMKPSKLEKPPTMIQKQDYRNSTKEGEIKRIKLLKEKLRLDHIVEGSNDIRKICEEFVDIFKLPRDSLNATTATEHSIPTPSIPKGRAMTLRNYRLPEAQRQEVKQQIDPLLHCVYLNIQLPGDSLDATTTTEHSIPTSSIPKGRAMVTGSATSGSKTANRSNAKR
jgi:hypothetical protein